MTDSAVRSRLALDSGTGDRAPLALAAPIGAGDFQVEYRWPAGTPVSRVRWNPIENGRCRCRISAAETDGQWKGIAACNAHGQRDGLDEFLVAAPEYELDGHFGDATFLRLSGRLEFWTEDELARALLEARERAETEQRRTLLAQREAVAARERARHFRRLSDDMRRQRDSMRHSLCWMMTAPLRLAGSPFMRFRQADASRPAEPEPAFPVSAPVPYNPATLVSVAVPVHNGARYLGETLSSILKQSHETLELVVVDDASSDNSWDIARAFARQDARVRILRNSVTQGMVANWNRAIESCAGDWIHLVGQDDLAEADAIESALRARRENIRLVMAARSFLFEPDVRQTLRVSYSWELPTLETLDFPAGMAAPETMARLVARLPDPCTNVLGEPVCGLVRRDLYAERGLYQSRLSQLADYEFWLRCVLNEPFVYLDRRLFAFRVHGRSATHTHHDRHNGLTSLESARFLLELLDGEPYEQVRARYPFLRDVWEEALERHLMLLLRGAKRHADVAAMLQTAALDYAGLSRRLAGAWPLWRRMRIRWAAWRRHGQWLRSTCRPRTAAPAEDRT